MLSECQHLYLATWDGQVRRIPSQAPYKLVGGARKGCCPNARGSHQDKGRRPFELAESLGLGQLKWAAAYAPIKYHYGTGSFNLGRRLKDYDPATDTWTNGPGAANWTYSYLDAHQKQLHLKSGSWVPRDEPGCWAYDQDEPTRSAMLAPYKPRVALE
eukprot:SAG25_NODE_2075_length_1980_cov_1.049973_1_plen_158_part_00